MYASQQKENVLLEASGGSLIGGIDEVGRGALAGPLVSICYIRKITTTLPCVKDSKQLSPAERMRLLQPLFSAAECWGAGIVEADEIIDHGMSWAVRESFERALAACAIMPDLVLYDGRAVSLSHPNTIPQVKGDVHHATIASASIIAKVMRDILMTGLHASFPRYHFNEHKGYGTRQHLEAIHRWGMLPHIHRSTFIHENNGLRSAGKQTTLWSWNSE